MLLVAATVGDVLRARLGNGLLATSRALSAVVMDTRGHGAAWNRARETRRLLSSSSPRSMASPPGARATSGVEVFDRTAKRLQKNRIVLGDDFEQYEMLKDEMAYRLSDRLDDFSRSFPLGLDVGCGRGYLGRHIHKEVVGTLVQADTSQALLDSFDVNARDRDLRVVADEELLPFKDAMFDIVISSLSMHWVNDLPAAFQQIMRVLKPDAPLVMAMFGGDTLFELRSSLQLAEEERKGGISQRVSPFTQMQDVGQLLHAAGFTLLTVDIDEVTIAFPSMLQLLDDLKGMGESNANLHRSNYLSRDVLVAADAIYRDLYGNDDGTIPASFQIIHAVGWKPDPSQPKPMAPGSATASFKTISETPQQ